MIARLRLRHARMWDVLLVVVPVVLVAALSVRRGEAVRQELPIGLRGEVLLDASDLQLHWMPRTLPWLQPGVPGDQASRTIVRAWHDAAGQAILEVTESARGGTDNRLLYWSEEGSAEIGSLWGSLSRFSDPSLPPLDVTRCELPGDSVLLGAWPTQGTSCYRVPQAVVRPRGILLLFDLVEARLEGVASLAESKALK